MSFFVPSFSLEFNLKCSFDPIFQDYHFETRHKVEAFGIEKTNKLHFKFWEESGPEPGLAIGHRKLFGDTTVRVHISWHTWALGPIRPSIAHT